MNPNCSHACCEKPMFTQSEMQRSLSDQAKTFEHILKAKDETIETLKAAVRALSALI